MNTEKQTEGRKMSDDIVTRLRNYNTCTDTDIDEAADEIERLHAIVEAWRAYSSRAERDIETLRAERDEARRMWCELMAANTAAHREQVANRHGWDCFKEAKNER